MATHSVTTRAIIGLEIHVQLSTATKMFCGCPVAYDAPPNSLVCAVCLGHPGALPVINREAVRLAMMTGLSLGCRIASTTKWDRKSYYYPDLPKNYQISQYDQPIASDGHFDIPAGEGTKRIRIRRAHLEEDAGKNIHDTPGCTLVDLNRAGTPLLEIVTEPDLSSADEAHSLCIELQRLVTYLGVSEGVMQKGQMRFEPNVNLAIVCDGTEYRTPIAEVKNLNSFRAVRDAIRYEIERQGAQCQKDREYVLGNRPNENRGWNPDAGVTEFQRAKEGAHDYRYFPDPDLVPMQLTPAAVDDLARSLPELPIPRRQRFVADFGMSAADAEIIVGHRASADLFEKVIDLGAPASIVSKQFLNIWLKLANDRNAHVTDLGIPPTHMADLAKMIDEGAVSSTAANRLAETMLEHIDEQRPSHGDNDTAVSAAESPPPPAPRELAKRLGLIQVRDAAATEAWVDEVFASNQQAIDDAVSNPKKAKRAMGFLRGQVMKLSGGKADPKLVGLLIEKRLAQSDEA